MNILVVSGNYPSEHNPNNGAFVYNLMQELASNNSITVISPQKRNKNKKATSYGEEKCKVIRPRYFSFSNKQVFNFNTSILTSFSYKRAVTNGLKLYAEKPEVVYTHFLNNAIAVLDYVIANKLPLVIASGESTYDSWSLVSKNDQERLKNNFSHIICVSQENKEQLSKLGFDSTKMSVIPNAVNYNLFQPLNKTEAKNELEINKDKFVVGFIGHFIHRKGPNRIIDAIEKLDDRDIILVCVGGKGVLKKNTFTKILAPVANFELPKVYNSFDVFVLPTLHEGSCNVIEEAKACAIPVISSKGTSVEEQVDESIGVLVDPLNVEEIALAIQKLKTDVSLRKSMEKALLNRRGENSIENRAKKINLILQKASSHRCLIL